MYPLHIIGTYHDPLLEIWAWDAIVDAGIAAHLMGGTPRHRWMTGAIPMEPYPHHKRWREIPVAPAPRGGIVRTCCYPKTWPVYDHIAKRHFVLPRSHFTLHTSYFALHALHFISSHLISPLLTYHLSFSLSHPNNVQLSLIEALRLSYQPFCVSYNFSSRRKRLYSCFTHVYSHSWNS